LGWMIPSSSQTIRRKNLSLSLKTIRSKTTSSLCLCLSSTLLQFQFSSARSFKTQASRTLEIFYTSKQIRNLSQSLSISLSDFRTSIKVHTQSRRRRRQLDPRQKHMSFRSWRLQKQIPFNKPENLLRSQTR
jgi:hypothetical protein